MSLKQQIYQHIQAYLDGEISAAEFEEWFIPATWQVDVERDADLGPLVAHITSIIVDFKDAEISEDDLRRQLSETASPSSIHTG